MEAPWNTTPVGIANVGWYTALLKKEAVQDCIGNQHAVEEFREQ